MAEENPQSLFQQVQAGAAGAGATMKKTIVGAADKAAAGAQSMLEGMGDIGAAAASAGSAIIKGIMNPMVGIVGLFALSLKHLSESEDRAQGVARATGLTGENLKVAQKQASHLHNRYRIFGATIDESIDSIQAVYNNMGNVDYTTTAAADQIMRFSKGAGVGAETTAKGLANMMLMQGATESVALDAQLFAKDLANAAGVPLGLVMSDIADISDDVAGYMSANPKELVKATVEARRLGLSLDQTAKMADSLLDFESSIEKEMEAQILTGKQLNYDRARALALQGDSVGAAKDLVEQIGGAAEFNKMNVVQQRALAQSVGLSVGEMKKALGVKDKEAELEEKRAEEMRQAEKDQATGIKMVATTMESFKQLLFDIGKILGDILAPEAESFMTFLKSEEGQRKMRETFITIKETAIYIKESLIGAFRSFFGYTDEEGVKHQGMWETIKTVIWAVGAPIRGILNAAQFVFEEVGVLGARLFKAFATYPAKMASIIKSMINGAKTIFKNGIKALFTGAKTAAKTGGSMFLKVLKKIPVIGALISFGFAISKFKKGDFIGAGLEIASGLASFIPGVGTAVSVGLDVVSGVRDVKMANQQDDFIYSDSKGVIPFNKDDLIIGGTKLDQGLGTAGAGGGGGGNVASKLDVIIGLLSKPGVVMLDGKKVGDTLAMAKSYVDD